MGAPSSDDNNPGTRGGCVSFGTARILPASCEAEKAMRYIELKEKGARDVPLNRRDLISWAGSGAVIAAVPTVAGAQRKGGLGQGPSGESKGTGNSWFNVRHFEAKGDGKNLDSPAINRAIEAAAGADGGTVYFPAGTYSSYSIRLKSRITLYLDAGSTILASSTPHEGMASGGYDDAEPQGDWAP